MGLQSSKKTHQNIETMAINRDWFMEKVVKNENLSRRDIRVCCHLLTHIEASDYRKVSYKSIAAALNYTKAEVQESVFNLIDEGIIKMGSNDTVENGLKTTY